jgi:TonB family protein
VSRYPSRGASCAALVAASTLIAGVAAAESPPGAAPAFATPELAEAACAHLKQPTDSPEVRTCVEAYLRPRIAARFFRNFDFGAACEARRPLAPLPRGKPAIVLVELYVVADGRVLVSRVVESSGDPRFDTATMQCTMQGRIEPRDDGGTPVAAWELLKWTWL